MFKTYIRISPIEDCVDIYFVEISPGLDRMITAVAKPMELQFERVGEGFAPMQPSLRIPGRESVQFLKSIAEALDQNGTKTDDDHKIAGTLEATKFHLYVKTT